MTTDFWCWIDTGQDAAAMNMALDEVLLHAARARAAPLLRVYGWNRPSISFGYFQTYPAEFASSHDLVRRPTGGGLVFHGKDLTYTAIFPPEHELCRNRALDGYRFVHSHVERALRRAGIACRLCTDNGSVRQGACFEIPVACDVMIGGKKIAGGAQRRTKFGLLHQGSLLLPPSMRRSRGELGHVLREGFGVAWKEEHLTETDRALAGELARSKYATDAWNEKFTAPRPSAGLLREHPDRSKLVLPGNNH